MSCENSTWINPCGLTTDEVDADFDNTSIDDLNKRIVGSAEVFSSQLNELRNYMIKTFPDIDEESLISHEFSFLKTPEKITDIYADSFGMLQKCAMALDVLKEESNESHMNEYDNMLKRLRGKLQEMLCCEHLILKIKSIPFNDVEVRVMDRAFRRNGAKEGNMIKHIIALRQIESNIDLIHSLQNDMNSSNTLLQRARNIFSRKLMVPCIMCCLFIFFTTKLDMKAFMMI